MTPSLTRAQLRLSLSHTHPDPFPSESMTQLLSYDIGATRFFSRLIYRSAPELFRHLLPFALIPHLRYPSPILSFVASLPHLIIASCPPQYRTLSIEPSKTCIRNLRSPHTLMSRHAADVAFARPCIACYMTIILSYCRLIISAQIDPPARQQQPNFSPAQHPQAAILLVSTLSSASRSLPITPSTPSPHTSSDLPPSNLVAQRHSMDSPRITELLQEDLNRRHPERFRRSHRSGIRLWWSGQS